MVYTLGSMADQDVTPISHLHTVDIDGYLVSGDRANFTNILQIVWDSIGSGNCKIL